MLSAIYVRSQAYSHAATMVDSDHSGKATGQPSRLMDFGCTVASNPCVAVVTVVSGAVEVDVHDQRNLL